MAEKKKSAGAKKGASGAGAPAKRGSSVRPGDDLIPSRDHGYEKPLKTPQNPDSPANQILLCLIVFMGLLLLACFILTNMARGTDGLTGPVGYWVCTVFYGLFGIGAYALPIVTVIYGAMWKHSVKRERTLSKAVLSLILVMLVASTVHMAFASFSGSVADTVSFYNVKALWISGADLQSGGVIGGFIGGLLKTCLNVIAWPVIVIAILAVIMIIFEITPNMIAYSFREFARSSSSRSKARRQEKRGVKAEKDEQRRIRKEREAEERERRRIEKQEEIAERERLFYEQRKNRKVTDISLDGDDNGLDKPKKDEKRTDESRFATESDIVPEIDTDKGKNSTKKQRATEVTLIDTDGDDGLIKRERITSRDGGKDTAPPKKTLRDVDINIVFDEDKRSDTFGFSGSSDIDGNERTDIDKNESMDIDIIDPRQEEEIDDLIDSLEDTLPFEDELPPKKKETPVPPVKDTDGSGDKMTRERVIPDLDDEDPFAEDEPEKPSYVLPPITLLEEGKGGEDTGFSDEVLERNGRRLVETLRSFKVDVDIAHISKGPTITRYELVPKAGVRVRTIANLVDDIALALETQGIRIEAPIPGKAAVGIEVPNKNLSTVYLRSLIDTDTFRNHKSKINCCLGKNVSGEGVYLDIAKMPHLLIAGATGMGKSVCINSLLISLLYKATPDEVKLILIDPKKVELNVYNKLPHLLVPVVNQPKMAAGSLAWAVGEMERRFELIEEVGVRDIAGYNKITANDPQKEFLPQIVIIIDELADLMMTAPVEVEQSIIRLAQKARAAGMHLIIGTQRPSVDVITGLIKANVPSRIAFTVASNIDSRTIIDVAGAEKLIGRGDMLYAPVGAMKPIRVQGSFVSDSEVERVTEFIKAQIKGDYDQQIISEIDRNAKQCGQKKKGELDSSDASSDSSELDEKFYDAVDVALEEGKVSTSLLQRRISVGYGRAAKIIDTMQKMGIVSPPDGQKPRTTLITRQDWDERLMRMDGAPAATSGTDESYGSGTLGEDEFDDDAPF